MISKRIRNASYIFIGLIVLLIYVPLINVVTTTVSNGNPVETIQNDDNMMQALMITLTVTTITIVISILIGMSAAIGLPTLSNKKRQGTLMITKFPLTSPDIVIALSLALFFFSILGASNISSMSTQYLRVILAHISFGIAYSFITIYPVAKKLGKNLSEASMDLGASPLKTVIKVIIPNIKGAIVAGAAIVFVMSFDDYIISKMVAPFLENISMYFMSSRRPNTLKPVIYAATTIMLIIIMITTAVLYIKRRKKKWKNY